jgi:hypothetical protein
MTSSRNLSNLALGANTLGVVSPAYGGTGTSTTFTLGSVVFAGSSGVYTQANSQLFWDNANNRLGIGTATPSTKLDVQGNTAITGSLDVNGLIRGQASALSGDVLLIGDNTKLVDINVLDTVGLYSQSTPTIGSLKLGSGGGTISGYNGNIGIGTTSPGNRLEVSGSGIQTVRAITTDTSGINIARFTAEFTGGGGGVTSALDIRAGDNYTFLDARTNTPLLIGTNDTERMRITSDGRVGIGTSSPAAKLHVVGGSRIDGDLTILNGGGGEGGQLTLLNPDNTTLGLCVDVIAENFSRIFSIANNMIMQIGQLGGTGGFIGLYTAGSERMRIDSSGNVGIGTSSPGAKLDLAGNYKEGVVTANTSTAYTISIATGTLQILTLTGNCTFTFPTPTAGQSFTIFLKQDATGGRTATWPASVQWPSSTAPTITSTISKGDKFVFTADGTYWWGSNAGQNYL